LPGWCTCQQQTPETVVNFRSHERQPTTSSFLSVTKSADRHYECEKHLGYTQEHRSSATQLLYSVAGGLVTLLRVSYPICWSRRSIRLDSQIQGFSDRHALWGKKLISSSPKANVLCLVPWRCWQKIIVCHAWPRWGSSMVLVELEGGNWGGLQLSTVNCQLSTNNCQRATITNDGSKRRRKKSQRKECWTKVSMGTPPLDQNLVSYSVPLETTLFPKHLLFLSDGQ
jgi:hypothetical protein